MHTSARPTCEREGRVGGMHSGLAASGAKQLWLLGVHVVISKAQGQTCESDEGG